MDNKWHFVAASYDGSSLASEVKLYIDGVFYPNNVVQNTLSGSIVDGAQIFMIGNQPNHQDFWLRGLIDEFSLSNVVRSASYIAAHSTPASPPSVDANTVLFYTFDEGTGTTATDLSARWS